LRIYLQQIEGPIVRLTLLINQRTERRILVLHQEEGHHRERKVLKVLEITIKEILGSEWKAPNNKALYNDRDPNHFIKDNRKRLM